MQARTFLGILTAVVAAAITSGAILVIGQDSGDPPKSEPSAALKPDEVQKTPRAGQLIEPGSVLKPIDHGPFQIVNQSGAPTYCDAPLPVGRTVVGGETSLFPAAAEPLLGSDSGASEPKRVTELKDLAANKLYVAEPDVSEGWRLSSAEAWSQTLDDGSKRDVYFGLRYEKPDHFYISVDRTPVAPGCKIQLIDHTPEDQHAFSLSYIAGVPVVIQHQAPGEQVQAIMQVNFVQSGIGTSIETVALDLDELVNIAESLIQGEKVAQ